MNTDHRFSPMRTKAIADLRDELRPTSFDAWLCLGGEYRDTAELQEWGNGPGEFLHEYREFCIRIHGYDPYEAPAEPIVNLIPYGEEIERLTREMKAAQDAASERTTQIADEDLPSDWSEHKDEEGNIYFLRTGAGGEDDIITYEHPLGSA